MSGLDDLLQPQTNQLAGTDYQFIDADTLVNPNEIDPDTGKPVKYRFQGIDAPETAHPGFEGIPQGSQEVGAQQTMDEVIRLANSMGYNRVVPMEQGTDKFGRRVVDLQDESGRSFRRALASEGILPVHPDYDKDGSLSFSSDYGAFLRTEEGREGNEWDEARAAIDTAINAEQKYENQFKRAQAFEGQAAQARLALTEMYVNQGMSEQDARAKAHADTAHINDFTAQVDYSDRDRTGEALNPLSTAWDTGMLGAVEGLWGMAELIGEKTGWEGLESSGTGGVTRARSRIADQGRILVDYQDVDSFGDAISFVTNNAAMSLPYMGISVLSALTAPVTGGLSLTAPAAVYAGQAWNEMGDQIKETGEERSASIAIATGVTQAALDRLGLSFVAGATSPKGIFKEGVEALMKTGLSQKQAMAQLSELSRRELAGLLGDAAKVAQQQVAAKKVTMDLVKRAGAGAAGEGVTEALQETIAAIGADLGSGAPIDWNDVQERAIAGAVAGSSLGGAFSVPGTLYDAGAWKHIAVAGDKADPKLKAQAAAYADEEARKLGYVPSIQEEAAKARQRARDQGSFDTLTDKADRHRERRKKHTLRESVSEAIHGIPGLVMGSAAWIFRPELQAKSRAARVLADMYGGNLQRIFKGSNFENSKHHRVTIYKNMVDTSKNAFNMLSGGKRITRRKDKIAISDKFYETAKAAIDPETGKFNPDLVPDGPTKQAIVHLATQMQALGDKMYQDQQTYNPDLGYIPNYLLKYKAFDTQSINRNRTEFIEALQSEYGIDAKDAADLTDTILNQNVDLDDAFSIVKGGPQPKQHKKRTLGLSENPKFNKFMERDMFANMSAAAKSAARYTTYQEFIGDNGNVINKLLEEMHQDGVPQEEVDKVAAQMQDLLDAESGNYKRPTSAIGKGFEAVQKNFMFITMIAGLPLATVSSLVELALTQRALTRDQIFGKGDKEGGLQKTGKEFVEMIKEGAKWGARQDKVQTFDTPGRAMNKMLGFYDWDVGAATTTGVSEVNSWRQGFMEVFFKAIGLQGWTNFTRAARASIAGDYIMDKLEVVSGTFAGDVNKTNEQQEAEQALRNLGIDPWSFVGLAGKVQNGQASPEEIQEYDGYMREAAFNFVNEAVALPQASNRPLIYQDPRFALFTQFQGFMSTFTANHIPRLWGEYVARGTPAMKYNAFAVMTTMIMLGFASQYLKDLIKYGSTKNPYLDDNELLQRGIRASGLLGTGERVLDQFFPLYETRSKDAGEWLFNTTTGESPSLSNLKRLGSGVASGFEGDFGRAAQQIGKSVTPLGPFTGLWQGVRKDIDEWNFGG